MVKFENELCEIENKIEELKQFSEDKNINLDDEIEKLDKK